MLVCIKRFRTVTIQMIALPATPANKMSVYKMVTGIANHKSVIVSPSSEWMNSCSEQLNVAMLLGSHRSNSSDDDVGSDVSSIMFIDGNVFIIRTYFCRLLNYSMFEHHLSINFCKETIENVEPELDSNMITLYRFPLNFLRQCDGTFIKKS